ncbi:hypothetical protein [Burkholderia cepacia]|uniref:hypothetical protein n=1 Tax=Burkholderia cepacia TaxID=292 RepID=UPI000F5ED931|nr:hypothetical protein [Burkholderia cepacia]
MNYLVILDARTPIGAIYSEKADGVVTDGSLRHPALYCSDVSIDHPLYLFVTRPLKKGESHQSLHVPHHAVVAIHRLNESDTLPIGFHAG